MKPYDPDYEPKPLTFDDLKENKQRIVGIALRLWREAMASGVKGQVRGFMFEKNYSPTHGTAHWDMLLCRTEGGWFFLELCGTPGGSDQKKHPSVKNLRDLGTRTGAFSKKTVEFHKPELVDDARLCERLDDFYIPEHVDRMCGAKHRVIGTFDGRVLRFTGVERM